VDKKKIGDWWLFARKIIKIVLDFGIENDS